MFFCAIQRNIFWTVDCSLKWCYSSNRKIGSNKGISFVNTNNGVLSLFFKMYIVPPIESRPFHLIPFKLTVIVSLYPVPKYVGYWHLGCPNDCAL